MFSRSYAPSYVLEQAANNGDESSLLPAARTPPPELTTMPDAIEMISEHQADTALAVIEAQVELQEVEIAQVEEAQAALPKPGPSRLSFASMSSIVGNALFSSSKPTAAPAFAPGQKRLSLPTGPSNAQCHIPRLARKSLSPQNAARRASVVRGEGTLLALPAAQQLHTLKARNAILEKSLASASASQTNGLFKATTRIAALEKELESKTKELEDREKLKLECEGWEAEAHRLSAELEASHAQVNQSNLIEQDRIAQLEAKLTSERGKKTRFKDMVAKLRCEMQVRRCKERWELAVMDSSDRDRYATEIKLEAEVSTLRMQLGIAELDKEDLEDTVQTQHKRLSELTASRQILLDSFKASEATIDVLRSELATSRKDSSTESTTLRREHAKLQATVKKLELELAASQDRCEELLRDAELMQEYKTQIETLRSEMAHLEEGDTKSKDDAKALVDAKKALQKETLKRAELEETVKEIKAELKQARLETRNVNKALTAASKATAKKAEKQAVVEVAEIEVAAESAVESEPEEPIVKVKKMKAVKAVRAATPEPDEADEEEKEKEDEVEEENEEEAADQPLEEPKAVEKVAIAAEKAVVKKRKAGVLANKSSNSTDQIATVKAIKLAKADKSLAVKKKKKAVDAEEESHEEPAKKKKRTLLLGGSKKPFAWGNIENADVNGLGIPSVLSPIKPVAKKGSSFGVLGKGLAGGRSSIFN